MIEMSYMHVPISQHELQCSVLQTHTNKNQIKTKLHEDEGFSEARLPRALQET